MKHKTYYDSELDTWVIDNSNIKKGEFDNNPEVITVNVLKTIISELTLTNYRGNPEGYINVKFLKERLLGEKNV